MSQTFFAKTLLTPSIPAILYKVPDGAAYAYCDLNLSAGDANGLTFTVGISKSGIIEPQDIILNAQTNLVDADGNLVNNFISKDILIGQGESIIVLTSQTDIVARLSGYVYDLTSAFTLNVQ